MDNDVVCLAREALDDLDRATTRTAPSERGHFALADGYRVAQDVDRALVARGWSHVGRKLAFTDRTTWPRLGVDRPAWGHLYDRTVHGADSPFSLAGRVAPRVETEIVARLARVPDQGATAAEVAASLEWVALGFEVIDCHYPGWRFSAADALADVVLHAGLVVGTRHAFRSEEDAVAWAAALPLASVTVTRTGAAPVSGSPAAVLGDPLAALAALVGLLRDQRAEPLRPGEIVTTGTMMPPFDVRPGDTLRAEMAGIALPTLHASFTG